MKTSKPSESRAWLAFLLIFALSAAVFGLLALMGWVLGLPRLASFGVDLIPMAPSTAVLFLLLGAAIGLRARTPLSRRNFWISVAVGCLGALAALLLFVLSHLNIHWAVEHLGLNVTGTVGGAPKGHISPVAASCFLLASVSFLASLSRSVVRRWRVVLASGSAGVLLATCFIFLLAYLYGAPLLYGGTFIPPSLNTVLAFTMLGVALLLSAARSSGPRDGQPRDVPIASYVFLLIFVFLAAGIVTVGYLYYQHYEKQYRAEVERQLSAIAELKVNELAQWRKERLWDAEIFHDNPVFSALVQRFFKKPEDTESRQLLKAWLDRIQRHYNYDHVFLTDTRGVIHLAVPKMSSLVIEHLARDVGMSLAAGKTTFLDLHRDTPDGPPHMAIMTPIFGDLEGRQPLGVVFMRIDPADYFYPLIKRWPTPSQTAETLLVRREGNEVLFLNELRFQTNTALNLRYALDRAKLPAAQAALGREEVMEGVDYRGAPVVAALRSVPDSPWAMVARMDAAEVYEPLRARLWQMILMVGVLLFGAGACVGLVWRQQRSRFYKEKAETEEKMRKSEAQLSFALRTSHIGAWELNLLDHTALRTLIHDQIFGYETLLPRWTYEMFLEHVLPEDRPKVERSFREATASQSDWNFECRIRRVDGAVRWIWAAGGHEQDSKGGPVRMSGVVQDITERKLAAEALLQSSQELQDKNAELERFLYTASHDLKSPVVTVRTFLGYLEQDIVAGDAARIEKDAHFIRAAADKMGRLLDELLEISRIGRVLNPPVRVTFKSLVDEALSAVAGRVAERGVTVQVGAHDLTLQGDRLRLAEIWQNLVENACKFMGGQKDPRIEIGVENRDADTVFFVRDNGIGIDPRYQAKIFNLFEKLDPKAEGTGLGLALVKRIVELYHGRIWLESAGIGQGACFYFTLPGAVEKQRSEVRGQRSGDGKSA